MVLLTVADLAERFRISRRQVYRLIEAGLPAISLGEKSTRFDPEAVEEWLEAQRKVEAAR